MKLSSFFFLSYGLLGVFCFTVTSYRGSVYRGADGVGGSFFFPQYQQDFIHCTFSRERRESKVGREKGQDVCYKMIANGKEVPGTAIPAIK